MPTTLDVPLRITLVAPPAGVLFCLQRGRDERMDSVRSDGGDVTFELTIQVDADGETPDFRGPFVQGGKGERFVYVRIGTLAGDAASCWTGRLKIRLEGLTRSLIAEVRSHPHAILAASVAGTSQRGGPAYATAQFLDGGWRAVRG